MIVTLRRPDMNKTEAEYACRLEILMRAGEVTLYQFERHKLKIGIKRCWYTPDFYVVMRYDDGSEHQQFHEVKGGFYREDAIVKLRAAAMAYPQFDFFLCQKKKTGWEITKQ